MFTHLIISGGGIKGISIIGALSIINKKSDLSKITHYIGSSIGGLICLLLSIGYTCEELYDIIINIEIDKYKETKFDNLFNNYGLDNGNKFMSLLSAIIKQKNIPIDITFKELNDKTKKELVITGSDLINCKTIYYNYVDTPDFKILDSIKITTCYPVLYEPIIENERILIDGGLLDPYPINYYKDIKNKIGIFVHTRKPKYEINNFEEYLLTIVKNLINNYEKKYTNDENNTIFIELSNIYSMKMDLSREEKLYMYNFGIKSATEYFDNLSLIH